MTSTLPSTCGTVLGLVARLVCVDGRPWRRGTLHGRHGARSVTSTVVLRGRRETLGASMHFCVAGVVLY